MKITPNRLINLHWFLASFFSETQPVHSCFFRLKDKNGVCKTKSIYELTVEEVECVCHVLNDFLEDEFGSKNNGKN